MLYANSRAYAIRPYEILLKFNRLKHVSAVNINLGGFLGVAVFNIACIRAVSKGDGNTAQFVCKPCKHRFAIGKNFNLRKGRIYSAYRKLEIIGIGIIPQY